jgi:hypothetical protein
VLKQGGGNNGDFSDHKAGYFFTDYYSLAVGGA